MLIHALFRSQRAMRRTHIRALLKAASMQKGPSGEDSLLQYVVERIRLRVIALLAWQMAIHMSVSTAIHLAITLNPAASGAYNLALILQGVMFVGNFATCVQLLRGLEREKDQWTAAQDVKP